MKRRVPMNVIYEIENLEHGYRNGFQLKIPSLEIQAGMALGIAGHNGSGKSTLMRLLAFLEKPSKGTIKFKGSAGHNGGEGASREVTLLLQSPYLLKRSVYENIAYGPRLRGDTANLKERIGHAMEWVGLDAGKFAHRRWFELSGGEAQRVALASRLVLKPGVLILDEPVANVDAESAAIISRAVERIRKLYNTTLIISSHDYYWLNGVTENIVKIHDGRIIGRGFDNVFRGPWEHGVDDLWFTVTPSGERIYATRPPDTGAHALLHPEDVIIAAEAHGGISAQNVLRGRIAMMLAVNAPEALNVEVEAGGSIIRCHVTKHAASQMGLLPGKDVWLIFKASSLKWHGL